MNPRYNISVNDGTAGKTVIYFEEGLYGFEDVKEYVLLQEDDAKTVWSLQAACGPEPSLIVIDPFAVMKDFSPALLKEDLAFLGNPQFKDLCFLSVAVLKENIEDSIVNLKSPIVINVKTRRAKQIILESNDYPLRRRLLPNRE